MKLVAKFTGNTIEGNFISTNENYDLLNKIKEDYYNAEMQFSKESQLELNTKSEDWLEQLASGTEPTIDLTQVNELTKIKIEKSNFNHSIDSNIEIFETETHKAIITLGKDLGSEFVNNFTTVEIFEK